MLAFSGSRAFGASIPIPVGTSYADGVLLTFGLPSGTLLDVATQISLELEFEELDGGEVLSIDVFLADCSATGRRSAP